MQSPEATPTGSAIGPETLEAWQAFLRAHAVLTRALERELIADQGLPLAEYDVLVQLDSTAGGRLRMSQLADKVLLSRSGLTRLVGRLEEDGLVERAVCPSDARGAFAVITAAGRERLRAAAPGHLRSVQARFGDALGDQQQQALRAALERLMEVNLGGREVSDLCGEITPGTQEES